MGKRGPKPKPKALNILEGNPSRREILPDDCDVTPDLPAVKPLAIELDQVASAEWDRILAAMPPHLYTAADVATLALYAQSWSLLLKAQEDIERYGALICERTTKIGDDGETTETEKYKANPAVSVWKAASENLIRTTDRLGLNPGVRARLSVPKRDEKPAQKSRFAGLIQHS